jgi:hypothetical protein
VLGVAAWSKSSDARFDTASHGRHTLRVTRAAAECFELETWKMGVKGSAILLFFASFVGLWNGSEESGGSNRIWVRITEKETGRMLFDEQSGDADLASLAANELASLDETEFRRRWGSDDDRLADEE